MSGREDVRLADKLCTLLANIVVVVVAAADFDCGLNRTNDQNFRSWSKFICCTKLLLLDCCETAKSLWIYFYLINSGQIKTFFFN